MWENPGIISMTCECLVDQDRYIGVDPALV